MDTIRWFARKTAVHSWRAVATAMAALVAAAVVIPVASSSAVAARPAAPPVPVLRWHPCDGTFPCVTASGVLDIEGLDAEAVGLRRLAGRCQRLPAQGRPA